MTDPSAPSEEDARRARIERHRDVVDMLAKGMTNVNLRSSEDWSALARDNQTKAAEELKKERETCDTKIEKMRAECDAKVKEADDKVKEAQITAQQNSNNLYKMSVNKAAVEKRLETQDAEVKRLQTFADSSAENTMLKSTVAKLQAQLDAATATSFKEAAEIRTEASIDFAISAATREADIAREMLQKTEDNIASELDSRDTNIAALEATIAALKDWIAADQVTKADLRETMRDYRLQLKEMQTTIDQRSAAMEKLTEAYDKVTTTNSNLYQQLHEAHLLTLTSHESNTLTQ
ncbi:hypothetical protein J4E85_011331 [Alternaria conjuncta]|uniref:uncharacterized protein n=1 Tax=Alternaria conjuncta TaxID=181017 RepID=UPI00221E6652|nr:uncharacterized protein J4E85_011331 [Alternaria conjuncta]KAI4911193.1 hypothetical protein J4E85_011331 [Alternaria conjuncta]